MLSINNSIVLENLPTYRNCETSLSFFNTLLSMKKFEYFLFISKAAKVYKAEREKSKMHTFGVGSLQKQKKIAAVFLC